MALLDMTLSGNAIWRKVYERRAWVDSGRLWPAVRRFAGSAIFALPSLLILFVSYYAEHPSNNIANHQLPGLRRYKTLASLLNPLYEFMRI